MKIGIYNEPSGAVGGSEYVVSVLADALSKRHHVDVIHHNHGLILDQLADLSGLDLDRVRLRFVGRQDRPAFSSPSGLRNIARRYQTQARWQEDLSRPYDVFIASIHNLPPFCHARTGVMLTLFPFEDRMSLWPWVDDGISGDRSIKQRFRRNYYDWLWHKRFDSYQQKLCNSEYTRKWSRAWWGIESDVLYPAVDTRFEPIPKANLVLSVGRFSTRSHSKRQVETMSVFRDMKCTSLQHWSYYSVGGLDDDPVDHAYFDEVKRVAAMCDAHAIPNIHRSELRSLFARAKVFWHAAGYGTDDGNPYQAEHFGISTVEAMAAGAVPIVYDKGGQAEIVEHGRNGYLWRSLDELQEYTRRLVQDEGLREQMAASARRRAERFSREAFLDRFARLVPLP